MRWLTVTARLAVGVVSLALLAGCSGGPTASAPGSPSSVLAGPSSSPSPAPTRVAEPSLSPSILRTAEPVATPVPTRSDGARWERVADQTAFSDSVMVAVTGGPDRFVAVGTTWLADGQDVGMAWASVDGSTWHRAATPMADGIPTGVIHDQAGYVAWGWWQGKAVVWTSPDGDVWRRATDLPDSRDAAVSGVARLGGDLVAVGSAEVASGNDVVREFRAWTSADGLVWTSVNPVTSMSWDLSVEGVTASDDALVAWGYARAGDVYPPVTMRSTDGRRWEVGEVKPGVQGYEREGILEITGAGGRLVAVGHGLEGQAGSPPPPSAAWTSADGLTWKPAAFKPQPATGWLLHVVWSDGAYVALGLSGLDAVVWHSVDGTTWTRSTSAPDGGRDGEAEFCMGGRCPNTVANDLAVGPAGLVAVGRSNTGIDGKSAVVWLAPGR